MDWPCRRWAWDRRRDLQHGRRGVISLRGGVAEVADLHNTPQRLLRLALLQLEEAKLGIIEAAFEENQAGGVVQRVAELGT